MLPTKAFASPTAKTGAMHRSTRKSAASSLKQCACSRPIFSWSIKSGYRPIARTVCARVHHHHAVALLKQKLRLTHHAHAVVSDSMENEHPIAVWFNGPNFPASQEDTIGGTHVKILTMRTDLRKGGVGFPNEVGGKFPTQWMQERRTC